MKKILLVMGVLAMVVSSCGLKTTAQSEAATEEKTTIEATAETAVVDSTKSCCEKDSTAACCEKETTKACCDKETKATEEAE